MKSKTSIFFIFIVLNFASSSFGQITFQKTFGGTQFDEGRSIQLTIDSGYIITGSTNSFGAGNYDVYLLKTDSNGFQKWGKFFGGTNSDFGHSVQQVTDGGYIIAGTTASSGAGGSDVYLLKTDTVGNLIWTKTFGGTNDDEGWSVQQTNDGGYIVAGHTKSYGSGGSDVYLIKTDMNGDSLWTRTFGGTNDDEGYSVQQTMDGGYVISGRTGSMGAGGFDAYLLRTDSTGNFLWDKSFGGANNDACYSVRQTTDGGFISGGETFSFGAGNSDVYLLRTNSIGDTLWTRTFGGIQDDAGWSVLQSNDGAFVIAGYTKSFSFGLKNTYIVKTDSSGNSIWIHNYANGNQDYAYSIQQTFSGGYILTGGISYGGDIDINLLKTDANGDTLWEKSIGESYGDAGSSVQQTTDGGYIISGSTTSFGAGSSDVYLIKTDERGSMLWTKTFGGIGSEDGHSVLQTNDGGYIITGYTYSFGSFRDIYLMKTDSIGNLLWSKYFGSRNGDFGLSIQQTSDGGFVITGQITGSGATAYGDILLLKINANGNLLWTKSYTGSYYAQGYGLQQTTDGGFIIAGNWYVSGGTHDVCLLKTDALGNLIWSKFFHQNFYNYGFAVKQTSDGGYIVTGGTIPTNNTADIDIYLLKTDSVGNLIWSQSYGGAQNENGYSVLQTNDGGFIIAGSTNSFGAGADDAYLLKTDSAGNLLWSKTYGGEESDGASDVQFTSDGGYIITGYSSSFGTGRNVYLIKTDSMGNSGCNENWCATLTKTPVTLTTSPSIVVSSLGAIGNAGTIIGNGGIENSLCLMVGVKILIYNVDPLINIFPNPASNEVTLTFAKEDKYNVLLYNTVGEILFNTTTRTNKMNIDLKDFSSGIYFVIIRSAGMAVTKKLIVSAPN